MHNKLLLLILLAGCSGNHNSLMTNLMNEKKVVEDSILIAHGYESDFEQKAKGSHDSLIWKPMLDSQMKYYGAGTRLKSRLEELNFSIDSLSKMK